MANLLTEKHDVFWREYKVVVAAGASAGIGLEALPPVRKAIGGGFETIINKSEKVKDLKNQAKNKDLTEKQKKQLTDEEKEYKSKRKLVQEKLIKFATRIPAFMYLTDFSREHAAGRDHQAGAGLVSGCHWPDRAGLPPACAPQGIQYRAD